MNILDKEKIKINARTLPSIAKANRILKSLANGSNVSQSCSNGPPAIGYKYLITHSLQWQFLIGYKKNKVQEDKKGWKYFFTLNDFSLQIK